MWGGYLGSINIETQWMQEIYEKWWESQVGKSGTETRWTQKIVERQGKPTHGNQLEMHAKKKVRNERGNPETKWMNAGFFGDIYWNILHSSVRQTTKTITITNINVYRLHSIKYYHQNSADISQIHRNNPCYETEWLHLTVPQLYNPASPGPIVEMATGGCDDQRAVAMFLVAVKGASGVSFEKVLALLSSCGLAERRPNGIPLISLQVTNHQVMLQELQWFCRVHLLGYPKMWQWRHTEQVRSRLGSEIAREQDGCCVLRWPPPLAPPRHSVWLSISRRGFGLRRLLEPRNMVHVSILAKMLPMISIFIPC